MKFRETRYIYSYSCPNCKSIVKTITKTDSDSLTCILAILWPIGIIYLLVKRLSRLEKKKTKFGYEELVVCKHCGKNLAINDDLHIVRILSDAEYKHWND